MVSLQPGSRQMKERNLPLTALAVVVFMVLVMFLGDALFVT
jgi:hypothetical protein